MLFILSKINPKVPIRIA